MVGCSQFGCRSFTTFSLIGFRKSGQYCLWYSTPTYNLPGDHRFNGDSLPCFRSSSLEKKSGQLLAVTPHQWITFLGDLLEKHM